MINAPQISIIVPVYNTSKYLETSINSIRQQTFKDIEIICVNDGSTDNSLSILEGYALEDSRIKIITQENKGLGAARNTGLHIAQGKYVSFIDSDDTVDIDFYLKLYETAEENNAEIIYAPFMYIRDGSEILEDIQSGEYTGLSDKFRILSNGAVTNKLFRKDLIENISFPEGLIYEDNAFLIPAVCKAKKIVIVSNTHYNYLIKENSLTTSKSVRNKRSDDSLFVADKVIKSAAPYCKTKEEKYELVEFIIRSFVANRWKKKSYAKKFVKLFEIDEQMLAIAKNYKISFMEKLFSVKNYRNYRVIRILGFKIKQKGEYFA